jgi:hypothetical protein
MRTKHNNIETRTSSTILVSNRNGTENTKKFRMKKRALRQSTTVTVILSQAQWAKKKTKKVIQGRGLTLINFSELGYCHKMKRIKDHSI